MGKTTSSLEKNEKNAKRREKRRQVLVNGQKVPRAPNRFILYRTWHQNHTFKNSQNPTDMRSLSKKIAEQWKNEPLHIKSLWDRLAAEVKLKSPYRSTADILNGLDMSISKHLSEGQSSMSAMTTFVNAFASSKDKNIIKNEKPTNTDSMRENKLSSFIFLPSESPSLTPEKNDQGALKFEDVTLNKPDSYKWEKIIPQPEFLNYDSYSPSVSSAYSSDDEDFNYVVPSLGYNVVPLINYSINTINTNDVYGHYQDNNLNVFLTSPYCSSDYDYEDDFLMELRED